MAEQTPSETPPMHLGDPDAPTIALSPADIAALLPHRHPFVLVDRVEACVPGHRATGIKAVTATEPWFAGHFPGDPVFPGVLLTEAFAQLAALVALSANRHLVGRPVLLLGVDKARFRRLVVPGDRVVLEVERQWVRRGIWRFSARAHVDGEDAASAELSATVLRGDSSPGGVGA